ncbi:MAG: hypothetical protein ACRC37_01925, partial [Lentisphaeria bacterium]
HIKSLREVNLRIDPRMMLYKGKSMRLPRLSEREDSSCPLANCSAAKACKAVELDISVEVGCQRKAKEKRKIVKNKTVVLLGDDSRRICWFIYILIQ